jgi:CheY-like chemotaxis protein
MRSGKTILFVDDELDSLDSFTDNFREAFEVAAVDDKNAVAKINEGTFDIVSIDIDMDTKDGIAVYRELRQVDQRSLVFVLTNLSPNDNKVKWFKSEGIEVFNKSDAKCADSIKTYIAKCEFHEVRDLSVLIIDDEKDKRDTYGELLSEIGFQKIEYCPSPEEAALLIKQREFDIYLIDMCFGQGDEKVLRGAEIVSFLKQEKQNANYAIIPISQRYLARDFLGTMGTERNLYPHFFEQPRQFVEKMQTILQRGPFRVNHA